jgi:hypothetical protein
MRCIGRYGIASKGAVQLTPQLSAMLLASAVDDAAGSHHLALCSVLPYLLRYLLNHLPYTYIVCPEDRSRTPSPVTAEQIVHIDPSTIKVVGAGLVAL